MKLSNDQLRQNAAAMIAFADGKPIECQNPRGAWVQTDSLSGIETIPHRPKPWTLPAPPAGKQWHRTDWTEEMLPGSFRPLLLGERAEAGDTCLPEMTRRWEPVMGILGLSVDGEFCPVRTLRPLPAEPVTRPWAKASDLPVGISYIRERNYAGWSIILAAGEKGLHALSDGGMLVLLWDELEGKEHSTDRKTWKACVTEEK